MVIAVVYTFAYNGLDMIAQESRAFVSPDLTNDIIDFRKRAKEIQRVCLSLQNKKRNKSTSAESSILSANTINLHVPFRYSSTVMEGIATVRNIRLALPKLSENEAKTIGGQLGFSMNIALKNITQNLPERSAEEAKELVTEVIASAQYLSHFDLKKLYEFATSHAIYLGITNSDSEKVDDAIASIIADSMVDIDNKTVDYTNLYRFFDGCYKAYNKKVLEVAEKVAQKCIGKDKRKKEAQIKESGLSPVYAMAAWEQTTSELVKKEDTNNFHFSYDGAINYNFIAMKALEKKQKGICEILAHEFNIYDFARYPQHILLDMVAKKDNAYIPYVTMVVARSDWNNVFYNSKFFPDANPFLDSIYKQLDEIKKDNKTGFALRIIEASGKENLMKMLGKMQAKYEKNGNQKMAALLLAGHGTKYTLQLGGDENGLKRGRDDYLVSSDFTQLVTYGISELPIVLLSCSSGQADGMGEHASRRTGAIVRGASEPVSFQKILIQYFKKSKRLWFRMTYATDKTKDFAQELHYFHPDASLSQ